MDDHVKRFVDLASDIAAKPGPVRLVGIDGCGGAGKTTFAMHLGAALDGAPIVHTDDFASHDVPTEWWPQMLHDVIDPLLRDQPASYRPYDWVARRFPETSITIEPTRVVLIEGVGATRNAWRDRLACRIWIDCPRDVRLERGIARDGEQLRDFWLRWMAAEDAYVETEQPWLAADITVDGAAQASDQEREYVELSGLSEPR